MLSHPIVKRIIPAVVFFCSVLCLDLYRQHRLFTFTFLEDVGNSMFSMFSFAEVPNLKLAILNTGTLTENEIAEHIDEILRKNPKMIGINTCDFNASQKFIDRYNNNPKIILGYCDDHDGGRLARIISSGNEVSRFHTDKSDYFEIQIAKAWNKVNARGNANEIIHFTETSAVKPFFEYELSSAVLPSDEDDHTNLVVLVGYAGDVLPTPVLYKENFFDNEDEEIIYYKSCRITPLNRWYRQEGASPDLYDIEISGIIITQLQRDRFINELPAWMRILIMMLVCVVMVLMVTKIQTRWPAVNGLIYFALYQLTMIGVSFMMMYAFTMHSYLLIFDELQALLLISMLFTMISSQPRTKVHRMSK